MLQCHFKLTRDHDVAMPFQVKLTRDHDVAMPFQAKLTRDHDIAMPFQAKLTPGGTKFSGALLQLTLHEFIHLREGPARIRGPDRIRWKAGVRQQVLTL
jgi:hypothetical protein